MNSSFPERKFLNKRQAWCFLNPGKEFNPAHGWTEACALFDLHERKWKAGIKAYKSLFPETWEEREREKRHRKIRRASLGILSKEEKEKIRMEQKIKTNEMTILSQKMEQLYLNKRKSKLH